MGYTDQRDALLAHAKTAAAAVDDTFTDVAIGAPFPTGSRCVRLFWTGEAEPEHMGANRVLNGRLVAPTVGLVAYWAVRSLTTSALKALDDEVSAFTHNLRTAVLADSQLGGKATDLEMGMAEVGFEVGDGTRWIVLTVPFWFDYIEYPLGA